jgi:hypothetical protein
MPIKDIIKRRLAKRDYERLHPNEARERGRRWYKKNKLRASKLSREAARRWRANNPEKSRDRVKKNARLHPETAKAWRKRNIEKVRMACRKRRALRKGVSQHFTMREWLDLKAYHAHRCVCCGMKESELTHDRLLVPDHVMPLVLGGSDNIDNIQPLCHGLGGCNNAKNAKHIDYRGTRVAGLKDL